MLPLRSSLGWAFTVILPLAVFSTAECVNLFPPAWNMLVLIGTFSLLVPTFKGHFEESKTWNVRKKAIAFFFFVFSLSLWREDWLVCKDHHVLISKDSPSPLWSNCSSPHVLVWAVTALKELVVAVLHVKKITTNKQNLKEF